MPNPADDRTSPPAVPSANAIPMPPKSPVGSAPTPELGGPKGLEPTRYGDWAVNGRCSDF